MLSKITFLFLLVAATTTFAQRPATSISTEEVTRIVKTLSSDKMEGRGIGTPGIEKAADFISEEFRKAGIAPWPGSEGYRQNFSVFLPAKIEVSGNIDGKDIVPGDIIAIGADSISNVTGQSGYNQVQLDDEPNMMAALTTLLKYKHPTIAWLRPSQREILNQLKYLTRLPLMQESAPLILALGERTDNFSLHIDRKVHEFALSNIVGVLPGKSRKEEFVIFSAHYDHLGIGRPDATGDSIYNGANDDASGTTAVIALARYFKERQDNERTLIFVAFTAEERGGWGSRYFSSVVDPDKVAAMFNIEMIGTDSKWGLNSAYITGFDKSDFGTILQKNLSGSKFRFEPDPYPDQQLFYRSDNATLAALGVPAHTISTSKMDNEPHYHKPSDEFETLDTGNMTEVIKAIALSSRSIVSGEDTPSRVHVE